MIEVDGEEVAAYGAGQNFGELALLYSAPRAASVIADTDGILWSLHRCFFRKFVKKNAKKMRGNTEKMLMEIPEFRPPRISMEELKGLADAMTRKTFRSGENIITQGEVGDEFFLIIGGSAEVEVNGVHVRTMEVGSYFGERALMSDGRSQIGLRTATVKVGIGECYCLVLSKEDFHSLVTTNQALMTTMSETHATRVEEEKHVLAAHCPLQHFVPNELETISILGRGAYGVVKLMRAKQSGKEVYAVKVIQKILVLAKKQTPHLLREKTILEVRRSTDEEGRNKNT